MITMSLKYMYIQWLCYMFQLYRVIFRQHIFKEFTALCTWSNNTLKASRCCYHYLLCNTTSTQPREQHTQWDTNSRNTNDRKKTSYVIKIKLTSKWMDRYTSPQDNVSQNENMHRLLLAGGM
jgi:hypothetical protein